MLSANTCNDLFEKIDISKIKNDHLSGQSLQEKYEEAKEQAGFYKIGYNRLLKEKQSLYKKLSKKKTEYYPVYRYKTRYVTKSSNDNVEGVMADVAGSLIVATLVSGIVYNRSHKFDSNPNSTTHYQFGGSSYHSSDMARAWRWGSVGAFFGSFGLSYTILRQF